MRKSKKQNYILKFWNGEESLGLSFWLVYNIGSIIVTLPLVILPETSNLILVFGIIQYPYLIWAIVGTWRSASKFKPKKNQWAWGTIAQVYIVLSIIRWFVRIINFAV